jgi:hypothetical protein
LAERIFPPKVKTTNGSARTLFFLSRNELEVSNQRPEDRRIYRLHLFASSPRIFTVAPPLYGVLQLRPELWHASFGAAVRRLIPIRNSMLVPCSELGIIFSRMDFFDVSRAAWDAAPLLFAQTAGNIP